jgi:hypothetical protein
MVVRRVLKFLIEPKIFSIEPKIFSIEPKIFSIEPKIFSIEPKIFSIEPNYKVKIRLYPNRILIYGIFMWYNSNIFIK